MKSLLIITEIDYKKAPNDRVQHLIRFLAQRFEDVTVVYRKRNTTSSFKNLFLLQTSIFQEKNIRFIEIDPLLNYSMGLVGSFTGYNSGQKANSIKSFFKKIFCFFTFIKDVLLVVSLCLTVPFKIKTKFDVCIYQNPWEGVIAFLLKKLGKVKFIVYDNIDYLPVLTKFRKAYTSLIDKYLLTKADLIICVSKKLAQLRRIQTSKEVFIVPNGVSHSLFKPAQKKIEHPPTLIYTGNVTYWSGLDLVIFGLQDIKRKIPDIRLLIVGESAPFSYGEGLKKMTVDLALEKNVVFVGIKKYAELPEYLREADIGLAFFQPVALRQYAFPLKVVEYISAGLVVIGTKGSETEDIIIEYKCGKAIEFTKEAFIEAVCSLFTDKAQYEYFSSNAKKYSVQFDWDNVLEGEYSLIKKLF
ncbi:MAG: glycosyltransferase family 4 protein [Nitrospirota bacterium]